MATITTTFAPDEAVILTLPTPDGKTTVRGRILSVVAQRSPSGGVEDAEYLVVWNAGSASHRMGVAPADLARPDGTDLPATVEVPYGINEFVLFDRAKGDDRWNPNETDDNGDARGPRFIPARVIALEVKLNRSGRATATYYRVGFSMNGGISLVGAEPEWLSPYVPEEHAPEEGVPA